MVNPRGKIPPDPRRKEAGAFEKMGNALCALGEAMLDPATTVKELATLARHCDLALEFRIVQPQKDRIPANSVSNAKEILRNAPNHFVFTDKDGVERRYIRTDNVGRD